jgi:hypothetical protein
MSQSDVFYTFLGDHTFLERQSRQNLATQIRFRYRRKSTKKLA